MKKLYIISLLVLLSLKSYAGLFGTLTAQSLCDKMGKRQSDVATECNRIVKPPAKFEEANLEFCEKFFDSYATWELGNSCLATLKNKPNLTKAKNESDYNPTHFLYCKDMQEAAKVRDVNNLDVSLACLQRVVDGSAITTSEKKRDLCKKIKDSKNATHMMYCLASNMTDKEVEMCLGVAKSGMLASSALCIQNMMSPAVKDDYKDCYQLSTSTGRPTESCLKSISNSDQALWIPDLNAKTHEAPAYGAPTPTRNSGAAGR